MKISKEVLGFDFILGAVYLPCESSRFCDFDVFENLRNDIYHFSSLYSLPFCLIGDFNCRTGVLTDFMNFEEEICDIAGIDADDTDFLDFKEDCVDLGVPIERFNSDSHVNEHGKKLIETCQALDLKIVNGRFGSDKEVGNFTCFNANGKSVVDYAIVSHELLQYISEFAVESFDKSFSDVHCPISIAFSGKTGSECISETDVVNPNNELPSQENLTLQYEQFSFSWDNNREQQFRSELSAEVAEELLVSLEEVKNDSTQDKIDSFCSKFKKVLIEAAKKPNVYKLKDSSKSVPRTTKPWFDRECRINRSCYMSLKNKANRSNSETDRNLLTTKCNEYKRLIKQKKVVHYKKVNDESNL